MSWKYRLLCWLGFHHWTYSSGGGLGKRCCLRCGERRGPVLHYPPRYKYTCYGCGGPLSAENAGAGRDCGFCQADETTGNT
jgi:hypothetical protein